MKGLGRYHGTVLALNGTIWNFDELNKIIDEVDIWEASLYL